MRLRQLVLASGLASLLASSWANALGLGEVTLNSTLNQPLDAEIKLLDTRDLSPEQIIISLASPADFERNGVDRLYFYTEFQFKVDLESSGGPVVRITSRNPVREPYLNFLVEARWTAGRLLREYTLLMDLPTFDDSKSTSPVSVARQTPDSSSQVKSTTQGRVNRQSSPDSEARTVKNSSPRVAQEGEYTVRPNDTLWDIAMAVRPDAGVSVHQAMVSLYEANPDAFINGNISRLKEGRVLRVPDASQMTSMSKSEAATQFTQLESGMGAELSASRRTTSESAESSDVSGRVTLAASNGGTARNSGQGSGADNGRGRALEGELTATLEELDKVKSENTELTSRVRDLEAQIQTMEKMVEVSNENMRALELSAEKNNLENTNQTSTKTEETEAAESSESVAASSVAATETKPKPEIKKQPPKPTVVPKVAPKPATLVDQLVANAPWIGIGVVVLGGLIGFLVYSRRKQANLEQEEYDSDMSRDDIDLNFDTSMDDQEIYEEPEAEEDQESVDSLDSDVDDDVNPADKADIFIAYGQLDKAENLLLKGLQQDPHSADIRLKLLEVYAQQQNAAAFDKHYAALIPIASPGALSRASELRSHIAGAGDFDMPDLAPDLSDEPAVKAQQAASLDDLEMDFGDDIFLDEEKVENSSLERNDDFSIELDLTEDFDAQDTEMRGKDKPVQLADDEFALDLDFDEPESDANDLELDFDGKDDSKIELEADDIGEISLALDDMDDDSLADDVNVSSLELEREPSVYSKPTSQELGSSEDDFNLDLDSDDVDLAALDDEMSSLDADFELDEEAENLSESDLELSLDDDFSLETDEDENLLAQDLELSLDDDLVDLDLAEETVEIEPELEVSAEPDETISEESLFEQALSDIDDQDVTLTEFDSAEDHEANLDSDDLDFLGEADEAATKLDLARAYIDMGDMTGARDILSEVVSEGTGEQRKEAEDLLSRIDA